MEEMSVGLQPLPISGLEGAEFGRFRFTSVDRKSFVDEKVPDFFAALPGIERFVLSVTDAAELGIGRGRFGAVAVADDLEDAFALVDLLAQHPAQIAGLGPEDILPDRLVAEKSEGIGGELPAAAKFAADGGDEDERKGSHRRVKRRLGRRNLRRAYSLALPRRAA